MRREELRWRESLAAFGIPIVLIADDPDLLATARETYADWVADEPATEPEIEIRLETESAPSTGVSFGIHVKGSRLTLSGPDFHGHADSVSKTAVCKVPGRLIGHPQALAAEVTDTLLLFLLTRSGRTPIHAAGIIVEDRALVLMGPSGSGKSTLALAAAQRGLRVLSDDTLYVQHEPSLRIWGLRRPIHVFPQDAPDGGHPTRLRGGKSKAVVDLPQDQSSVAHAGAVVPILLDRGERLELTRLGSKAAIAATPPLEPGFDLLPDQSAGALGAVLGHGAWRLTLTRDPGAAIDFLLERFAADGSTAATAEPR